MLRLNVLKNTTTIIKGINMSIDFTSYLPEGAKESMLKERIQQLASEGLANQIAKDEAELLGNTEQVEQFANNIETISSVIKATETQLAAFASDQTTTV
jgi:hypothetical protein